MKPEILPHGLNGLVVRFAQSTEQDVTGAVQSFLSSIPPDAPEGITEIAASLCSVRFGFDPRKIDRKTLSDYIETQLTAQNWYTAATPQTTRVWRIPVGFGPAYAPQLNEVAALTHQTVEDVIQDVTCAEHRVLAIGFAPGQPYIGILPEHWGFARQETLTPQVPAGALTAAVRQLVLFTNDSTTGWRQIGRCGFRPFLQSRNTPFLLRAGDAIRFEAVSDTEIESLLKTTDGLGGAICDVLT